MFDFIHVHDVVKNGGRKFRWKTSKVLPVNKNSTSNLQGYLENLPSRCFSPNQSVALHFLNGFFPRF